MKNQKLNEGMTMETKNTKFTAQNTKLFAYSGSKLKYKNQFTEMHNKMKAKAVKYYIEVFSGSLASLFHNLAYIDAETIIINDINPRLINLYNQIKNNHKEVIEKYKLLEQEFQRIISPNLRGKRPVPKEDREQFQANNDFYLEARKLLNKVGIGTNQAALFLFVLNHNYNGLYSENKRCEVNCSFNWSAKHIDIEAIAANIRNLHEFFTVNTIIFETMNAKELLEKYKDEDTFIYLDPPYINSDIQYTKKNIDSFNNIDTHFQLLEECNKYKYVLYSNNHHEMFVERFDNYLNFKRTNSISDKDKKAKLEILAYKINEQKALKPIPIAQLLGIEESHTATPVNNQVKGITQLLNLQNELLNTEAS